ncbi:MAG: transglycosylase SLT domain-containing protein [Hyphomicrobium sp.]
MGRWAWIALLIAGVLYAPLGEAFAASLSRAEINFGRNAFEAAKSGDWRRAQSQIGEIRDPLAVKLMRWHRATQEGSPASFDEISAFVVENPDWPSQHLMRERAEKAITPDIPPRRIIGWFERFEPLTPEGRIMFSRALVAVGDRQKARDAVRSAWINNPFPPDGEESFLREFDSMLTLSDHAERLELLLWADRSAEAMRMLPKVDPNLQSLARARMQLRSMADDVDAAVARVPPRLQNDAGLIYERIRWRRMKERNEEAIELLLRYPLDVAQPRLWAIERQILARRALASRRFREAYRIASVHAVDAGAEFAEAEWLAGWIALRFLHDPKTAEHHFETMYKGVSYPISLARGAYWRGRAAEALGESADAKRWYLTAAEHPTTYYGQLAAARVVPDRPLPLPPDPQPSADERRAFEASEMAAAVRMLAAFQQLELATPFLASLGSVRETPGWHTLTAALATEKGRPDLAVLVARRANQSGAILVGEGYPSVPIPSIPRSGRARMASDPIEQPLVLAIIRQESAYRTDAISSAGARGLMQLMPGTAQQVAAKLNLPYSAGRLITDTDYNLTLGQTYFHSVLDRFDGSYVLALAGYNAGPYRVQQWRTDMGDPKVDLDTAIDWIERIPFSETRNYVQRILEHLQVYRSKLNGGIKPKMLEIDLQR